MENDSSTIYPNDKEDFIKCDTMKNVYTREPWLDNLKMLAMLAIIIGHSYSYLHGGAAIGATVVQNVFISFAIPVFMFVSGITSFNSAQKSQTIKELISYLEKITLRLGIPNFIFTNITGLIQNVYEYEFLKGAIHLTLPVICVLILIHKKENGMLSYLYKILILGIFLLIMFNQMSDFWFLRILMQALTLLAACAWTTKRLLGHYSKWCLIVYMVLMALYPSSFSGTLEFMFYFIIGGMMRQYLLSGKLGKYMESNSIFYSYVTIVFLFVLIFFILLDYKDFYNHDAQMLLMNGKISTYIYRQFCAISWIAFWTAVMIHFSNSYTKFSKWGSQTLELYLIHVTLITIPTIWNVHVNAISLYSWGIYLTIAFILIAISLELIKLINLWSYGYLLFGTNKRKTK